jgi:starch synthase (maltosyl-transferring)
MLFHANVLTRLALPSRNLPWCAGIRVADPSKFRQFVERRMLTRAQKVICVSRQVADYAARRLRTPSEKLVAIPNGVRARGEPVPADLTDLGVPAERKVIVCIARLAAQKGIDQLLQAAPLFLERLPEHDLLLVGDGPDSEMLRAAAQRLPVARRIHFCGWQPHVREILHASDLLVLPSRWEGMPNVLLEAMAAELPVVCTEVEGIREVLEAGSERQVVPAEDPQALANQVVTILADPQLTARLGLANRQRVVSCFSLNSMIERYAKIYHELV